ncbi:MAG: tRNA pseudouridine(55) synthase TruB [Dehalococcoidia bacterium]|nr:tRNA pseudouridine(55) synthase TruB [Dehalococcoidia bacterium]
MDGILNILKPAGMTSFDVVHRVRRLSGERRVGHGGTLDPMATGVLPLGLGQGVRVLEFLESVTKVYRAVVRLGAATDTDDAEGRVLAERPVPDVSREALEAALDRFRGRIQQVPPRYSALKRGGTPLYKMARAGIEVTVDARTVTVLRLDLLAVDLPLLTLEVECGKGTYIRAIARDLGDDLGCGAHLQALERKRVGPFALEQGFGLVYAEDALREGRGEEMLEPIDVVLTHLAAAILGEEKARAVRNGQSVAFPADGTEQCRAYSWDGELVAILRPIGQLWQPYKVFTS